MNSPVGCIHYQGDLMKADQKNAFKISLQPLLSSLLKPGVNIFCGRISRSASANMYILNLNHFELKGEMGYIFSALLTSKTWKNKRETAAGDVKHKKHAL